MCIGCDKVRCIPLQDRVCILYSHTLRTSIAQPREWNFSKVGSLLHVIYNTTTGLTFENVYLQEFHVVDFAVAIVVAFVDEAVG